MPPSNPADEGGELLNGIGGDGEAGEHHPVSLRRGCPPEAVVAAAKADLGLTISHSHESTGNFGQ